MDQRWQRKTAWALESWEVGTQAAEGGSENHGKVQEYCKDLLKGQEAGGTSHLPVRADGGWS